MTVAAFVAHLPLRARARTSLSAVHARPTPVHRVHVPTMRQRPRTTERARATVLDRVRTAVRAASSTWELAEPGERVAIAAAAMGLFAILSTITLIFAQATATIALLALPLIALPLLAAVGVAMGAAVLVGLVAFGGGALLLAPIMAAFTLVKVVAVAATFAFAAVVLLDYVRGGGGAGRAAAGRAARRRAADRRAAKPADADDERFREFDKAMHDRTWDERDVAFLEQWSVDDVVDELVQGGLAQFVGVFEDERIDGATLLVLSETDVRSEFAGRAPLGARLKLWRWVAELQARHASTLAR